MSDLPSRNALHLPRRLFHMFGGTIIALFGFFLESKIELVSLVTALTILSFGVEGLRMSVPQVNQNLAKRFSLFMRAGEENRWSGIPYYLMGCAISTLVFPRVIAVLAILYLAFGDPIASMAGSRFGRRPLPETLQVSSKSVEGSIACFVVCFVITFFVAQWFTKTEGLDLSQRLLFSVLGGLCATLGELLPLRTDDNLVMPLVSGASLWLMGAVLHLLPGLYLT